MAIHIVFKNVPKSLNIEEIIQKKTARLQRLYPQMMSCHVVVDEAQKHRQGKVYGLHIDLKCKTEGKQSITALKQNPNIRIAINNAFKAIEHQLETAFHKQSQHLERFSEETDVMQGYVERLIIEEGYGFIHGKDDNEYYFSLANVSYPRFNQLHIGDRVEYVANAADQGWHADRIVREKREVRYHQR